MGQDTISASSPAPWCPLILPLEGQSKQDLERQSGGQGAFCPPPPRVALRCQPPLLLWGPGLRPLQSLGWFSVLSTSQCQLAALTGDGGGMKMGEGEKWAGAQGE